MPRGPGAPRPRSRSSSATAAPGTRSLNDGTRPRAPRICERRRTRSRLRGLDGGLAPNRYRGARHGLARRLRRLDAKALFSGAVDGAARLADSRLPPERELAAAGARVARLPLPADLVVLGMGDEGHTASWFPHAAGLAEAMDSAARTLVASIAPPDGLEPRLTLTGRVILRARRLALQIEGADKLATLARAMEEGPVEAMPIRAVLRQAAEKLTIFSAASS